MSDSGVTRKLAAIVAGDVVGYSRLMAADEAGTLAALMAHREAIGGLAAQRGGRIVGSAGDSVLLEFASIVDAVDCVIAAQRLLAERNADLPEDRRMLFRMGVNLGDVLIDGDDIFGEGVNIAARLESLSRPGGICISGDVQHLLPAELQAQFEDQGKRQVKNIPRPLHVWQWTGTREIAPPAASTVTAAPATARTRVLVQPFESRGGQDEQRHFAADLADDMIAALSRMTALVVVDDATEAHDFTIAGNVRWAGDRVRISAHLTDEIDGTRVWTERYDRSGEDIFALEDEIAETIVASARIAIKQQEGRRLASRDLTSLSVPELLSAAAGIFTTRYDGGDEARRYLERAVALQPGNSMAQAMLAIAGLRDIELRAERPGEAERQALARRAREAVRLDPRSFFARMALGLIELHLFHRPDAAAPELERALELNPHLMPAQSAYGLIRCLRGDASGAAQIRHAIEVDPREVQVERFYFELAVARFAAGDLAAAGDAARQSLSRAPDKPRSQLLLLAALALQGQRKEAAALLADLRQRHPPFDAAGVTCPPFIAPEDEGRYLEGLRLAGLGNRGEVSATKG